MGVIAWFVMVTVVALAVPLGNLQSEMEELIDLDRNNWDAPPPVEKMMVPIDDSTAATQYKIEIKDEETPRSVEDIFK